MKSLKSRIAMAAAILAAAGAVSANAADAVRQDVSQAAADATFVDQSAPNGESAQFERFENEMQRMSAPSYTPSEHPDAKPAPRSKRYLPSVFDDPMNTSSLG